MKVLLVHMDKLIQRNSNEDTDVIEKGTLKLEKQFRKAYINGEFVDTTPKEFDLLVYMCENEKVVLKRENILDAVWGLVTRLRQRSLWRSLLKMRRYP